MNVYDNTCFPLRQHTDKSEEEIESIVNRRLREVGLTEAMYKMPNELSGGMRKRAASPVPWCWTRRSSCSTSPTPALTRSGRRCSAS